MPQYCRELRWYGLIVLLGLAVAGSSVEFPQTAAKKKNDAGARDFPHDFPKSAAQDFPHDFPKDIPGGKQASLSLDPQLVLESGMHPTELNRISVDKRGELLVTSSEDRTARLWDLKQQLLLRTLRPPLGIQQSGKVTAVVIHPDGKTIAIGAEGRISTSG